MLVSIMSLFCFVLFLSLFWAIFFALLVHVPRKAKPNPRLHVQTPGESHPSHGWDDLELIMGGDGLPNLPARTDISSVCECMYKEKRCWDIEEESPSLTKKLCNKSSFCGLACRRACSDYSGRWTALPVRPT